MDPNQAVYDIVDAAVKQITQQVAHIDLIRCANPFDEQKDVCSLSTVVAGGYKITLIYHADNRLLNTIASRMKRSDPSDEEDAAIYLKEYFNILCGHVVAAINRLTNRSARFGIPNFIRGVYSLDANSPPLFELCYESTDGDVRIRGVCQSDELETQLSQVSKREVT